MKHQSLLVFAFSAFFVGSSCVAQPRYDKANMKLEKLNRGVVAIRDGQRVIVSWRCLSSDAVGEAFTVYRNGERISPQKLTQGGTFFIDEHPLSTSATYEVRGGTINGSYTLPNDAPDGYIPIPIEKPVDGTTPDGRPLVMWMATDSMRFSSSGTHPMPQIILVQDLQETHTSIATVWMAPSYGELTWVRTFAVVRISSNLWSMTSMVMDEQS